eukprot:GFYU01040014.1.p2 GENE.GFYU01040014.1~~GFYU01040014.1.p2  ORF type:complete len:252 (+),score=108.66 GFYU01040014.1:1-756(+)
MTLDEAEDAAFEAVCERAQMKDGLEVMDMGCGWGSLSLWLCEHYPNAKVFAVSNSTTQQKFIQETAKERGYKNLEVHCCDINKFETTRKFDRVMTIEMMEHMKNYESLMDKVSSFLKPDGMLFVHIFVHRMFAYEFRSNTDDWMAKNFFAGGTMPSDDLLLYFQKNLKIVNHWRINGQHYEKTLNAWLEKMDKRGKEVWDILEGGYGKDGVKKAYYNWRLFFIFCAEVWGFDGGNQWCVAHYLFKNDPKGR